MNVGPLYFAGRLVIALIFAYGGLLLISAEYDLFGIPLLLLSFVVAIPESAEAIVLVIVAGIQILALVLVVWAPYRWFGDVSLAEWFSDNWHAVGIWGLGAAYGIVRIGRERDSAWDTLRKSYGSDGHPERPVESYPEVTGTMVVFDAHLDVGVSATERGLYLRWKFGRPWLLPWGRLQRIRVDRYADGFARIRLRRLNPVPLELRMPWHGSFDAWLPEGLAVTRP